MKRYFCDNCGDGLGDEACSNRKGGSYCSMNCAEADDIHEAKYHEIDGVTYKEVDRKADVGDTVLVTEFEGDAVFLLRKIIDDDYACSVKMDSPINGEDLLCAEDGDKFVVLEPVHEAPKSYEDIIANLTRRVHALEDSLEVERQWRRTLRVKADRHELELKALGGRVEDVAEIAEPRKVTSEELAEKAIAYIRKYADKVEELDISAGTEENMYGTWAHYEYDGTIDVSVRINTKKESRQ